ncbi:MAG: nitroreductase family deazaflavin-dependent oxidoreductase [Actinobacteria bacterium]|nr:nitroreductase family deazaflavin-dependent oxidoreductase [Actinomycetota bacterium]MBW3649142.1 nitroreductase family deazaflavin-dependent oxidoreductase [Actinomycetota bacterium]
MNTKDIVARGLTTFHERLYRASRGRVGGRICGMPVLLLSTTGRKTGRRRTTPLTYTTDGDNLVLVASYGGDDQHPAWYLNLSRHPLVEVERAGQVEQFVARTATAEEKARLWPGIVATYKGYGAYQRRTQRDIPLVILTPHATPGADPPPS